jgi:putative endonuclease
VNSSSTTLRTERGRAGEERVAAFLSSAGWAIVGRNWRTRRGELDIIAVDGDSIVFVEVKSWPHGVEADLELAIGSVKQRRMVETAKCFLDTHRQYNGMYVRFDVILVSSDPASDADLRFRHLKDAFSERA